MTCYRIFNFRPTYLSYFQKILANSYSHNVKKQVEQKRSIPEVKGLTCIKCFYVQFEIPEMEFQRKLLLTKDQQKFSLALKTFIFQDEIF